MTRSLWKRLACLFRFGHRWHQHSPLLRTCTRCGLAERWSDDESGWTTGYWVPF